MIINRNLHGSDSRYNSFALEMALEFAKFIGFTSNSARVSWHVDKGWLVSSHNADGSSFAFRSLRW